MRRREALAIGALTLLPLLPFLDEAVSIDAPVFVAVARQVLASPGDPLGFQMVWDSSSPNAWQFNRNPPLFSYWLAAWIALGGEREWILHLAALPFPLAAGLAFLGIARRTSGHAGAAAALLVTTPAFLVLATTLMLDLPLLACWLLAVYALLRGCEAGGAGGGRWLLAAGGAAAAAGLTKYVGLAVLPLLLAGAWWLAPRRGAAVARLLAPPLLAWGGWAAWTGAVYGSVHLLGSTDVVFDRSLDPKEVWNQLASTPVYYGCALIFPIALWGRALARGRGGGELAVAGILVGAACAYWVLPQGEPSRRNPIELEESVFAALGLAGAVSVWGGCLLAARWRTDPLDRFLALWLVGLLGFTGALNWHVNAADALLAAPPALLLLFRHSALRPGPRLTAACAALSLALSLLLAWADAIQADAYRRAATLVAREIGAQPGNRWFVGQWGLQHYLEREGFRAVVPPTYGRAELAEGDWVASARNVAQIDVSRDLQTYRMRRTFTFEQRHWLPLRTTNPDAGAGFYSSHYGYVPFAWSRLPFEQVQLGRVLGVRGSRAPVRPRTRASADSASRPPQRPRSGSTTSAKDSSASAAEAARVT
jgi:4-amino-4-deoxy-L-arabinose transferase-like glycosyltransferase